VSPSVLGLDVGTSGLKAVLLDADGRTLGESQAAYPLRTPQPGWTEQDPEDWWLACQRAVQMLWEKGLSLTPSDVAAVGVSGQMHSLVLLDSEGDVCAPAILWSDQRTGAECEEIVARVGASELRALTGNRALPGFTAPKLMWVRRHWPDAYRRARRLLLPKDFLRVRLTDDIVTDVSDASGTLLFDVRNRRWSRDMVGALGIDESLLPRAAEGISRTGSITSHAASMTGLVQGTPVVAGGGDNAAAAVGVNVVEPGVGMLSIGTSGVLFAPIAAYPEHVDGRVHVFCHALPERWHLMAVTLSAGGSLRWFRDLLAPLLPVPGDDAYDWLLERAASAPAGADGLVFLPYLTGERTPYSDPRARGAWVGLHLGHSLDHMARAVLEGVAFSQRQGLDLLRASGAAVNAVRGAGGGLQSAVWRQILADALQVGVQTTRLPTGAARGAAVLAGLGEGLYRTPDVGIRWADQRVDAPGAPGAAFERAWRLYDRLYPALASIFEA
jgi:xylulokinase